ncbi:MAG: alpha amylase C-terminal domain-containing protein, partial [Oscillospiraceae bacterium]
TIGVPENGLYEVFLNTNSRSFGGNGKGTRKYTAKKKPFHGFPYSIEIALPPLTALYMKKSAAPKSKKTSNTTKKS